MVPESQGQVSIFSDTIIAQTEITLRQVTKVFRVQDQLLEISSIDTCTSSHTETCRRVALCFSLVLYNLVALMKTPSGWWIMFAFLAACVQGSNAATAGNSLSLYALNANGMVNIGKMSQIRSALKIHRPHILTISETKTSDKVGNKLRIDDYNFFEETGVKMDNHHLYKWGMVVGIRRDIQVAQRVQVPKTLEGRVVALDLVIGTNAGKVSSTALLGYTHRGTRAQTEMIPTSGTKSPKSATRRPHHGQWRETSTRLYQQLNERPGVTMQEGNFSSS